MKPPYLLPPGKALYHPHPLSLIAHFFTHLYFSYFKSQHRRVTKRHRIVQHNRSVSTTDPVAEEPLVKSVSLQSKTKFRGGFHEHRWLGCGRAGCRIQWSLPHLSLPLPSSPFLPLLLAYSFTSNSKIRIPLEHQRASLAEGEDALNVSNSHSLW